MWEGAGHDLATEKQELLVVFGLMLEVFATSGRFKPPSRVRAGLRRAVKLANEYWPLIPIPRFRHLPAKHFVPGCIMVSGGQIFATEIRTS